MKHWYPYLAPEGDAPPSGSPPAPAPSPDPSAGVLAAAAQAVEQARVAVDGSKAKDAELTALKAQLAALEAKVTTPASDPTRDATAAWIAKQQRAERLTAIRQMGFNAPLSDADILRIAPDVDPSTPEGSAALAAWKTERANLFAPAAQAQRDIVADLGPKLGELQKKTGLFNVERGAKSILFGKGGA